jgi:hypothetical protein
MRPTQMAVCVVLCITATLQPLVALAESVPSGLQTEVTKALKEKLGTPGTAQISFDQYYRTVNGAIVCGEIAARDAPQQPFYFIKVDTTGALTGSVVHTPAERDMASMVCKG